MYELLLLCVVFIPHNSVHMQSIYLIKWYQRIFVEFLVMGTLQSISVNLMVLVGKELFGVSPLLNSDLLFQLEVSCSCFSSTPF
jgi:hypothetical protein